MQFQSKFKIYSVELLTVGANPVLNPEAVVNKDPASEPQLGSL